MIVEPTDPRGWQRWSDTKLECYVAAHESSTNPTTEDLVTRMLAELEDRDVYRSEHDDTPSLDLPGGYGS